MAKAEEAQERKELKRRLQLIISQRITCRDSMFLDVAEQMILVQAIAQDIVNGRDELFDKRLNTNHTNKAKEGDQL